MVDGMCENNSLKTKLKNEPIYQENGDSEVPKDPIDVMPKQVLMPGGSGEYLSQHPEKVCDLNHIHTEIEENNPPHFNMKSESVDLVNKSNPALSRSQLEYVVCEKRPQPYIPVMLNIKNNAEHYIVSEMYIDNIQTASNFLPATEYVIQKTKSDDICTPLSSSQSFYRRNVPFRYEMYDDEVPKIHCCCSSDIKKTYSDVYFPKRTVSVMFQTTEVNTHLNVIQDNSSNVDLESELFNGSFMSMKSDRVSKIPQLYQKNPGICSSLFTCCGKYGNNSTSNRDDLIYVGKKPSTNSMKEKEDEEIKH
uniref:Uncharacterized protein n=1 Tax=Clastoptera arizonana TaxID=38151 RepID=A0A1B6CZL0_9HEMI